MGGGGSKTQPLPDLNVRDGNVDSSFHIVEFHSPTMVMGSIGLLVVLGSAYVLYRVYQSWLLKTRRNAIQNNPSVRHNALLQAQSEILKDAKKRGYIPEADLESGRNSGHTGFD